MLRFWPTLVSATLPVRWPSLFALVAFFASCSTPSTNSPMVDPHAAVGAGEMVYQRACATCHDGNVTQAPRKQALAILPADRIEAALSSGIMQNQAAGLTPQERRAVSHYLSQAPLRSVRDDNGLCPSNTASAGPVRVADWGMDPGNTRAVTKATTNINVQNAGRLKLAWVFALPNSTRARVQPTVAGDVLFTADQNGIIYALDAKSGCLRWRADTSREIRSALVIGSSASGAAERLYFGDISGQVHAFDIASRKLIWSSRPDDHPQATITGSLRLFENKLFVPVSSLEVVAAIDGKYKCCTFRGSVAALDANSGKLVWQTHTIDELPTERGLNREGVKTFGPSGAPVWSPPTIDVQRRRLYVGTGENYSHPASDKSDSILALDLDTGKVVWHHQALSEDVWNAACADGANCPVATGPDYDFGAPPILVKTSSGRSLVLAGQKSGVVFAFDPDKNGEVVWTAKAGRGGIMGGVHWGMTTNGDELFVPVSDLSVYPKDAHLPAQSGLHAYDVSTGAKRWATVLPDTCGQTEWRCSPGISAPATYVPGVVFGGSLDGMLRAFSAADGSILWSFDTNRDFDAVNSGKASGGGIDSSGPVVAGDFLYATSGYDKFGQKAGNLLLAFTIDPAAKAAP